MSQRYAGEAAFIDPGADKPLRELGTYQCCHCGAHHFSGKLLGYCANCNGFFCGGKCEECIPQEKMLEIMEGTCDPTAVSAGGHFNGSIWMPS